MSHQPHAFGMTILPHAENATIPIVKIRDYVLNPDHAVGRHKAQVIAAGTGLGRTDYRDMVDQIQRGIMVYEAVEHHLVDRNKQFYVEMPINGPTGSMIVRTIWIYEEGNDGPRLTTVYPSRRPA
jgi:hypothetical protein